MADLPDHSSSDVLFSAAQRPRRRLSYASQSSSRPSQRQQQQLRAVASSASVRSLAESETDLSEIHSPVPRRHYLLQTESSQWLNTTAFSPSPTPSRAVSPSSPTRADAQLPFRRHGVHTLSFGSLLEHDRRTALQPAAAALTHVEAPRCTRKQDEEGSGAGRRWLMWMHQNRMQDLVLPGVILASTLLRWCIGLGSYSGQSTPPMFGDYEAQRHWMEVTASLPTYKWYTYELQYWGLDYPPLTAYHSWLCGIVGKRMNPAWFALDTSRGHETRESKVYMRTTVLLSDLLVYIPAIVLFVRYWHSNRSRRTQNMALLTLLLQPSLLLIDFGHFQYNSVMLGFTVLALNHFSRGEDLLGAAAFVASLCFKQMALYYAPAIGAYLFGKCISHGWAAGSQLFIRLGVTTLLLFAVAFLPFLPPFAPLTAILDPITRIFPFARGIFEDKVANFWCATNVLVKWRTWFSQVVLIRSSALLTALGFLPAVGNLLIGSFKTRERVDSTKSRTITITTTSTLPILPWALLTSSMSFFLFSFQVHEKTILLPLLPLNLLLSGAQRGSFVFEWVALVNNVAVYSMWPLLKKDGLAVPYFAVSFLWNWVIGYSPFRWPLRGSLLNLASFAIYAAILLSHLMELFVSPPARYPDLFAVLNVLISTPVFVFTWLWSIKRSVEVTWGISGVGARRESRLQPNASAADLATKRK